MEVSTKYLRSDHQRIEGNGRPSKMALNIICNFPDEPIKLLEFITPFMNVYGNIYVEKGYHYLELFEYDCALYEGGYLILSALKKNRFNFWTKYYVQESREYLDDKRVFKFNVYKKLLKDGV